MEVKFNKLRTPAFINEIIDVSLEICNDEEEDAHASLGVQIMGYPEGEGMGNYQFDNSKVD